MSNLKVFLSCLDKPKKSSWGLLNIGLPNGCSMNFKILLEFFIKMEKEQTDIRTDKDRQPARGKGEGGEGEGRYMPVTASSCPHKKQMKIKMQMKYKI